MFDFITIGSATRDVFMKGDFEIREHGDSPTGQEQCFPFGSKVEVKELYFSSGGGGTNAAVTFARQGWHTACVSVLGEDLNGQEIISELAKEGVSTEYFQKHFDDFTAFSVILAHSSGERTILSYKGEGQHFNLKNLPLSEFKTQWFFLNSLGGNFEMLEAIIEYAGRQNIKVAMNPGGRELAYGWEKLAPILSKLDIFIANKEEVSQLLNLNYHDDLGGLVKALKSRVKLGVVAVTDGPHGVIVSDGEGRRYAAGVPDSPIIERTGAGDAWSAGFVSEYSRQGDITKAIQLATANASSVVTKFGGKAGILKQGDEGPWPLVEVIKISE